MAQDQQTPVITTTPAFAMHRRERVLVGPAAATPCETICLSDIDDQETLRQHTCRPFSSTAAGPGRMPPPPTIRRMSSAVRSARLWCRTTRSAGGCARWRTRSWSSTAPARTWRSWRPMPTCAWRQLPSQMALNYKSWVLLITSSKERCLLR